MKKAIEVLNKEHQKIKMVLEKTKQLFSEIVSGQKKLDELNDMIVFFRKYADSYHHHKEEEILFPEMLKKNEMLQFGIIHEMLQNHEDFREMLSDIEEQVAIGNANLAQQKFNVYEKALLEHIAVEDDELFQIAETLLSEDELTTVLYLFEDCDRELGMDEKLNLETKYLPG